MPDAPASLSTNAEDQPMAKILSNRSAVAPDRATGTAVYVWKTPDAFGRHGRHEHAPSTNGSAGKLPDFVSDMGIEVGARPSPRNETPAFIRNTRVLPGPAPAVIRSEPTGPHGGTGDGARLVEPHDPAQLAIAIGDLFDDGALSSDLRRKSGGNAGRYSWTKAAMETEAVIDAGLDGDHP